MAIRVTPENQESIVNRYQSGESVTVISRDLGIHIETTRRILKANPSANFRGLKYKSYNRSFFNQIDTEQKAYFLGLLFADGNVSSSRNQVTLSLKSIDREILEKFIEVLEGDLEIKTYTYPNGYTGKPYESSQLILSGKEISAGVIKHGCIPNKSLLLSFPETIPNELIPHFIRGYFDGDGCIHWNAKKKTAITTFTGTPEFLTRTREYLESAGVRIHLQKMPSKPHLKNTVELRFAGRGGVLLLRQYLYKNATVFLERKKNLFDQVHAAGPLLPTKHGIQLNQQLGFVWIPKQACKEQGAAWVTQYINHKIR